MIHDEDTPDLFSAPAAHSPDAPIAPTTGPCDAPPRADGTGSIGARLRAARESAGLSLAECGVRLHLPVKVLQRLEADDLGTPEHFVFLRGALRGYAALLGLPHGSCDDALRAVAPAAQPALVSVARTSHARWLLQRYGTAATYIVLTATIAVPLVLLGLRGGLDRPATRIVSLDQATTVAMPHATGTQAPAAQVKVDVPAPNPADLVPLRASMTPFSAIGLSDFNQPKAEGGASAAGKGPHTLAVAATGDCWVEVTDAEGNKLASELLHAGDSRTWHASGTLHVVLGNVENVSVTRDGEPLALADYRRANVARFDVFAPAPTDGRENH